jgi:hypothetical protein
LWIRPLKRAVGLHFECTNDDEAKDLANNDPFIKEGLYNYKVSEWKKVAPEDCANKVK